MGRAACVGRTERDGAQRNEAGGSGVGGAGRSEKEQNGTGRTGWDAAEQGGRGEAATRSTLEKISTAR